MILDGARVEWSVLKDFLVGEAGFMSKFNDKAFEPLPALEGGRGGREDVCTGLGDDRYVVESFRSIARLVARGVVVVGGLLVTLE